ncbi:MAG: hypothetical protein HUU56_06370 [Bdellovibrionaceae bacterium]|nr:hypothetical protein [Pseudobdellovibrionaceae bacterium]
MKFILIGSVLLSTTMTMADNSCLFMYGSKSQTVTHPKVYIPKKVTPLKEIRETLETLNPHILKSRIETLSSAVRLLKAVYGPLEYKQALGFINGIDKLQEEFVAKISKLNPLQDREFGVLMVEFFSRLNDPHVSLRLNSDYARELPIQMTYINGKYYVNWISAEYPVEKIRKPKLLDQVIKIENVTVDEFISRFPPVNAEGNEHTNKSLFVQRIVSMSETSGLPLLNMNPNGLRLTLRDKRTQKEYTILVPYKEKGTPMLSRDMSLISSGGQKDKPLTVKGSERQKPKDGERPFREDRIAESIGKGEGRKIALGDAETLFRLPKDAVEIEFPQNESIKLYEERIKLQKNKDIDSSDPFNRKHLKAYIFKKEINGKVMNVGFLRVPSYSPSNPQTIIYSLRYVMSVLGAKTDLLIIDQMNNPGGFVSYSDALIRNLVPEIKSENQMQFLFRPTKNLQQKYHENAKAIENFVKNEVVFRLIIGSEKFDQVLADLKLNNERILAATNTGDPFSISEGIKLASLNEAMQMISDFSLIHSDNLLFSTLASIGSAALFKDQPYPKEKPIYFLVNEKDFSGGDATPAGLQDQGRVKIVGVGAKQTAGAGGTVETFELSEMGKVSLTTSLMYRPLRQAKNDPVRTFVENVGVEADVVLKVTPDDYINGFQGVLKQLYKLISDDMSKANNQNSVQWLSR